MSPSGENGHQPPETSAGAARPKGLVLSTADVTGFMNANAWRYADVLQSLKDVLARYALSNEGRTVVHSIYSRGHKQQGGYELRASWQIKWKVNDEREHGSSGFAIQDIDDIIGITVVCNFHNQTDHVLAFLHSDPAAKELIKELREKEPKDKGGYRGRHFVAQLRDRTYEGVLCEIQMKGVLDDAWARWQHDLTYKPKGPLPEKVHERMEKVSKGLQLAGEWTESFKEEIESNWDRDRARKHAACLALARLIEVKPPKGRRRHEFKALMDDLYSHADDYATGDVDGVLARIDQFTHAEFDPWGCWGVMQLAVLRSSDDLDQVALDRIERNLARATDLRQRSAGLNIKSIACFLFNQLVDAVEASELALDAASEDGDPRMVADCQGNLAYHLAELGDKRGATRAQELAKALVDSRGGEGGLEKNERDTVGLVKIVFGKTREEVVRGLELCRLSLEKTPAKDKLVAKAFHELHDRLGVERLERIDAEAVRTLAANGCNHALYFELNGDPLLVPLRSLRPTKPPASQPDSVLAARACMAEAAAGLRPRRAPIDVRRLEGDVYEIVDGNATYGVALEAGWPDLPAKVV